MVKTQSVFCISPGVGSAHPPKAEGLASSNGCHRQRWVGNIANRIEKLVKCGPVLWPLPCPLMGAAWPTHRRREYIK